MKTQLHIRFWLVLALSICLFSPLWSTNIQSDLRVKIDVNSRTANRGDIVYFSVIVFNDGPDAVSNVQLLHKLEGVTFQYRRANDVREGTVEHTNGRVVCNIATVPAGGYVMFQYFVQVTASQGTKIVNWVEVVGAGGTDPDSTPNNGNPNEDDMASIDMDILGGGYAPVQTPTTTQPTSVPTPVQPTSANPSVRTSKSSYLASEKILVTYSGLSGSKSDWIAITKADLPANQFGQWFYTEGKTNGQFEYNALGPGTYEARVYFNWPDGQFAVKASARFTVEAQQAPATSPTPATIPTPPVSTPTPPVSLPTSTSSVIANWASNAVEYRGKIGQRYTFVCPANGSPGSIWGTDVYTDDSSICGAGVHTGTISKETGGDVTIEMVAGQTAYQGTLRNGIQTTGYGGWHGSYVVVAGKSGNKMGNITQLTWGDQADKYRGQNGLRLTCNCPAGGDASRLWGTDIYTDDSSICLAAVHAGLITKANGGQIVIEIRAGQASYAGSNRNGVQSAGYGGWHGSFAFVR